MSLLANLVDNDKLFVYIHAMITAAQIKAARSLLGWTQDDLAGKSGVAVITIKNIERGATQSRADTLGKIKAALQGGGAEIINQDKASPAGGPGVRLR